MWQFTILDFTQSPTSPQSTPIQEPIGWDAVNLHLKRDETGHGFFGFEDDTFSSLQYDGNGAQILRNAYYTYGIQAKVQLAVTYNCQGVDPDSNLYLGTFDFTTLKDYTADRCYVECATLVSEAYYLFKNRKDQQVDLDSLASFDQLPVTQTVTCNASFENGTNQIRVSQLLNGLMAGSKITITGSTQNGANPFMCTVASAKPDYSNVNPDGPALAQPSTISATFDANNMTISISQLVNINPGSQITIGTATWPSGNGSYPNYDNSGTYTVSSVQQFFNYTRLTISAVHISNTGALNGHLAPGYMVSTTQDSVTISGSITFTTQPTHTIITVAEGLNDEQGATITITGQWLQNNMQPYTALGKIITVPAKIIEATSIWKQIEDGIYDAGTGDPHAHGNLGNIRVFLTPEMTNIQSDIDETGVGSGVPFVNPTSPATGAFDSTHTPETLIYFRQGSLACNGVGKLKSDITYQYIPYDSGDQQNYLVGDTNVQAYPARLVIETGPDPTHLVTPPVVVLVSQPIDNISWPMAPVTISGEVDNVVFEPGTYLWMYFAMPIQNQIDAYYPKLLIGAGSTMQFTINSQCEDTPCSVYLVNEALSRCTESYTNGQIQVYSDYFGRTNAQPVASTADGCGGLACITNGLRIRGCTVPDGSAIPKFFTSLNDMFTALDAIHNIGMGMEADPNRPGMLRLRLEPFEWFFPEIYILNNSATPNSADVLTGVMNYTREVQTSLLCSTFKCGYQQFETWNNNGLYDIFGDRKYRTPLNHLENEIDKTCKWMASDYAIEFTRRQFGLTTSDSRYDDATFILCLFNKYEAPVETTGSCIMVFIAGTGFMAYLNAINISGSVLNNTNGTARTVRQITTSPANPQICYVYFDGGAFNNEYAASVTFEHDLPHGASESTTVPCFFIGANGAFALNQLDLYNAAPGDSITVTNTGYANGPYTIDSIYPPLNALASGNTTQINFPMIIFPTTPVHLPPGAPASTPQYDLHCIINDTTNQFYAVEQGMANGTNILSPATVMNYRISPAHAAMRHYRNIITDRQYAAESLIFTGGTGNFYALGQLTDSCSPENGNISEGGNLGPSNFAVPGDGKPLFYPEIIKFEYPLTWAQFLQIQAWPYGLIQYKHANDGTQEGWLTDLQYHPYTGLAEFTLYPKIA